MLRRLSAGASANSHTLRQCSGTCSYARIFCASGQGSAVSMDNSCRAVRWQKLNLKTWGRLIRCMEDALQDSLLECVYFEAELSEKQAEAFGRDSTLKMFLPAFLLCAVDAPAEKMIVCDFE